MVTMTGALVPAGLVPAEPRIGQLGRASRCLHVPAGLVPAERRIEELRRGAAVVANPSFRRDKPGGDVP